MLRAFEFRDFRLLWISSLAASFAMQMQIVARGWLTYDMTQSPLALTWVMLSFMAPSIIISPFGGLIADRYSKKPIMVIAQLMNAMATVILAWIIFTGNVTFWHFIYFGLFNGTVMAFSMPSRSSVTVEIVGKNVLVNAMMLSSSTFNFSRIVGPPVAGILIAVFAGGDTTSATGVGIVYFLITALFVVSVIMTTLIHYRGAPIRTTNPSVIGDLHEALDYVKTHRVVAGLMILGLIPMTFGFSVSFLMPVFNSEVFSGNPDELGFLFTAMGIGALTGSLLLAQAKDSRRKGRMMFIATYCWAIAVAVFSVSQWLWLAMVIVAFSGLFGSIVGALNMSVLQLVVGQEIRGRMNALNWAIHGLTPIGYIPIGWVAEFFNIQFALLSSAAVMVLSTLWISYRWPEVMKIGRGHDEIGPLGKEDDVSERHGNAKVRDLEGTINGA